MGRDALIFLPGLLCDDALWTAQVEALGDVAEISVADLTQDDNIAAMAGRVIDGAPDRFALAGLSMGGYVALEIMRQAPERVTRLALLDTTARPDTADQTRRRKGLLELAEKGNFKGVTPRLLPLFISEEHLDDDAIAGTVMAMAERVGKDAFIRQQRAIMGRADSLALLESIDKRTLVLCGADDALTPVDRHLEMAEAIPDADLVVLSQSGHLPPIEQPAKCTAALRTWLTV